MRCQPLCTVVNTGDVHKSGILLEVRSAITFMASCVHDDDDDDHDDDDGDDEGTKDIEDIEG